MKDARSSSFIIVLVAAILVLNFRFSAVNTAATVTFTKDVAPILYGSCATCHRPGEMAPMSLLTYKEVRPWAKSIRERVLNREMPPWYADPNHGQFANDSRLTERQIETIRSWVDGGAKEGDPKDLPPAPKFSDDGWRFGEPDAVFTMTEAASIPADGTVPYRYFAVPTNFTEDKYVQFAQIKRGEASVVHHVIVSVREPGQGQLPSPGEIRAGQGQGQGNESGSESPGAERSRRERRGTNFDAMLLGWAPGMSPLTLRPGNAKLVKKGSVLVFQMHYTTNGRAANDRTGIALWFAKEPVEKRMFTRGISTDPRKLVIPAGEPNFESHSSQTFNEDVHIHMFMPHMHVRGKDFEYKLVYPDGREKILLRVPKYDFNWQLTYFAKEPIAVPQGSRIDCMAHHDNSAENRFNPDPGKEVRWGDQTWEEMMIGWIDYTVDSQNLRTQTQSASNQ